ncbi:hypothetical protein GALMADRAFT_228846 [Galerina marginata CBS 339.88]|uniref:Uncharacterized protein n=1 Tax=Galerina marginata (strain CBS 339.88) TaxID=685588 RepID=A0A067SNT8_GALM3|nr:hypothetical protein GALMADRAFT_228846 [Galerina marginata CBS 339.88]
MQPLSCVLSLCFFVCLVRTLPIPDRKAHVPRENIYQLRALEDPIFITAYKRPSISMPSGRDELVGEKLTYGMVTVDPIIRDIIERAQIELERRSIPNRRTEDERNSVGSRREQII